MSLIKPEIIINTLIGSIIISSFGFLLKYYVQKNIFIKKDNKALLYMKHEEFKNAVKIYEEYDNSFFKTFYRNNYIKILYNLGICYFNISRKEKSEQNIMEAIRYIEKVISISHKKNQLINKAKAYDALGVFQTDLSKLRNRQINLEKAISSFAEAIKIYMRINEKPKSLSLIYINISNAYLSLSDISNAKYNANESLKYLNMALEIFDEKNFQKEYGILQNNLGNTYHYLGQIHNDNDFFDKAIKSFNKALIYRSIQEVPKDYAITKLNLGALYFRISEKTNDITHIKLGIKNIHEAINIITQDEQPYDYYLGFMNLGNLYMLLFNISGKIEDIYSSINYFKESFKYFKVSTLPQQYAQISINLGTSLRLLYEKNNDDSILNESIFYYEEAAKIFTLEHNEYKFASLCNNCAVLKCLQFEKTRDLNFVNEARELYLKAMYIFENNNYLKDLEGAKSNLMKLDNIINKI